MEFLKPDLHSRKLENGVEVFSFYNYDDISELILSKNSYSGFYIFRTLAKNSFKRFAKELRYRKKVHALPIDDKVRDVGYSQTAILSKSLQTENITPIFGSLQAKSDVKYAGKSLKFRKENRRDFEFKKSFLKFRVVILVDDVITTGTTLTEASEKVIEEGFTPLFCLTLATT